MSQDRNQNLFLSNIQRFNSCNCNKPLTINQVFDFWSYQQACTHWNWEEFGNKWMHHFVNNFQLNTLWHTRPCLLCYSLLAQVWFSESRWIEWQEGLNFLRPERLLHSFSSLHQMMRSSSFKFCTLMNFVYKVTGKFLSAWPNPSTKM